MKRMRGNLVNCPKPLIRCVSVPGQHQNFKYIEKCSRIASKCVFLNTLTSGTENQRNANRSLNHQHCKKSSSVYFVLEVFIILTDIFRKSPKFSVLEIVSNNFPFMSMSPISTCNQLNIFRQRHDAPKRIEYTQKSSLETTSPAFPGFFLVLGQKFKSFENLSAQTPLKCHQLGRVICFSNNWHSVPAKIFCLAKCSKMSRIFKKKEKIKVR